MYTIIRECSWKLISSSPNKSCHLDSCVYLLAKPIATIINASISQGVFFTVFQTSSCHTTSQKFSFYRQKFKKYYPVSNINYVSQLMQKVVANQLRDLWMGLGLTIYFKQHINPFILLRLLSPLSQMIYLTAWVEGNVTALMLLDLSVAFDTIDHKLILDRLEEWFDIRGELGWLMS